MSIRSSNSLTNLSLHSISSTSSMDKAMTLSKTKTSATRSRKKTAQDATVASSQAVEVSTSRRSKSATSSSRKKSTGSTTSSSRKKSTNKMRDVIVEITLPESSRAAIMKGIKWEAQYDMDMKVEAEAVMRAYSAPTDEEFAVWNDHAPANYLQFLKGGSRGKEETTLRDQLQDEPVVHNRKLRKECTCASSEDGNGVLPETGPNGHFFTVGTTQVDVKKFMHYVEDLGGHERVTKTRQWSEIARQVGIDTKSVRYASTMLKRMHLLVETKACKSAGGSLHWHAGRGGGGLVLDSFLDLLAGRPIRPGKKTSKLYASGNRLKSMGVVEERERDNRDEEQSCTSEEACVQYLVEELGVRAGNMARIFKVCPQLRHLSVPNNLRPTVRFLVEEAHVPENKLAIIIRKFPQVLGLSVDGSLRPMLRYLVDVVGIPEDKIGKVLVTRPQLLAQCIAKNLVPKIRTLIDLGGVPENLLGNVVAKQPAVLGLSDGHIRDSLNFLTDELGISSERVGKILVNSPQVLGLSLKLNLRPKIKFLTEKVGVPQSKVGAIIGKFPNILGYSIESNMLPKLQFLADEVLKVPLRKMGRVLVTCPQLLGYSLEMRIKPRHQLLTRRNMHLSISRMLAPSDLEFRRILRAADRLRAEQAADEAQKKLSFEDRHGISSVEKMDSNGNIRPWYDRAATPAQVEVGDDGEFIVPLSPKTMSGLFYWHFNSS